MARTNSQQRRNTQRVAQVEETKTTPTLQERIAAEEKRWAEVSTQLQRQYQMEFGAHEGRIALLKEMLNEQNGAVAPVNENEAEEETKTPAG